MLSILVRTLIALKNHRINLTQNLTKELNIIYKVIKKNFLSKIITTS